MNEEINPSNQSCRNLHPEPLAQAGQELFKRYLITRTEQQQSSAAAMTSLSLASPVAAALRHTLVGGGARLDDRSLQAYALTLPSEAVVGESSNSSSQYHILL